MGMTSMNVSLPDTLKAFVEKQVVSHGYGTVSEYIRDLVRLDQRRMTQNQVEALLIQGLDSPAHAMARADWERVDKAVEERLAQRQQQGT